MTSSTNSGRFVRAGRRIVFSRADRTVQEALMSHGQIGTDAGITPKSVDDAGLYAYTSKTNPPQLSLYSIGGNKPYDPKQRSTSVDVAYDASGGKIEVIGYDDKGPTGTNIVDQRS